MQDLTIPDQIKNARKVSTPLLAVSTADQWATVASVARSYKDASRIPPIVQWDCCRGFASVNDEGQKAIAAIMPPRDDSGIEVTPGLNLAEALAMATKFPRRTLLFLMNAHRFFDEPSTVQGIMNLREPFKENQRTIVLLGPVIRLPVELQMDVMTFDEALPDAREIERIVVEQVKQASEAVKADETPIEQPDETTLRHACEALTGLAAFPVEQSTAVSLASSRKLDIDALWLRKRAFVQQTKGLKFDVTRETFADVGGIDVIKQFGEELFGGALPPTVIVRIDEIEKHMAGASGPLADSSGTSQDQLGVILREMEDNEWRGLVSVGPPGSGKSFFTKTLGRTFGIPTLELDLGALKGSLVGQSEENIRVAMKVIKAIAGEGAYFTPTCNKLDVLPPELRRRFVHGIWFFDLPTPDELRPIWTVNLKRYGLDGYDLDELIVMSENWTGAEVRNVCRLAYETRRPVQQMKDRIVPVIKADPESIERLRKSAAGKFLSASHPGPYVHPADRGGAHVASGKRFLES